MRLPRHSRQKEKRKTILSDPEANVICRGQVWVGNLKGEGKLVQDAPEVKTQHFNKGVVTLLSNVAPRSRKIAESGSGRWQYRNTADHNKSGLDRMMVREPDQGEWKQKSYLYCMILYKDSAFMYDLCN